MKPYTAEEAEVYGKGFRDGRKAALEEAAALARAMRFCVSDSETAIGMSDNIEVAIKAIT